MLRYYCTCKKDTVRYEYQHTKMFVTEVDDEGICIYCGHYAFTRANPSHELFPRANSGKPMDMEINTTIGFWSDHNLFYQYFHGYEPFRQGLSRKALVKDIKEKQDGRKRETRLERTGGNRG